MTEQPKRGFNWLILIPPVIFFMLFGAFYLGMQRENPNALPSALEGTPAPAIDLAALPPETVGIAAEDFKSSGVKLVNFWASWCGPCRAEHPTLQALADSGLPIYGINYKDSPGNARGFLEELGNPFAKIGTDTTGRVAIDWGVYGVPETFVVDGEGNILTRYPGPITQKVWEDRLAPFVTQ